MTSYFQDGGYDVISSRKFCWHLVSAHAASAWRSLHPPAAPSNSVYSF